MRKWSHVIITAEEEEEEREIQLSGSNYGDSPVVRPFLRPSLRRKLAAQRESSCGCGDFFHVGSSSESSSIFSVQVNEGGSWSIKKVARWCYRCCTMQDMLPCREGAR